MLLGLTSCTSPKQQVTIECKYIIDSRMNPTIFTNVPESEITDWILHRYPVQSSAIDEYGQSGISSSRFMNYRWLYNKWEYIATFTNDQFTILQVTRPQANLSGGNFTTCLGDPDFYTADYIWINAPQLILTLWYVDEGILVKHVLLPNNEQSQAYIPEITKDSIFPSITVAYMQSNNIVEMVSIFYNPLQDPQLDFNIDRKIENLQVWESWDELKIQIDPMLQ